MSSNRRQRRAELAGKKSAQSPASSKKLAATPEAIGTLLAQAVRLHQVGNLAEAVARYEQALSLNPNIPEALSNLGLALKALGKADAAIARYEQALALKPDAPEILCNLGIVLKDRGRVDEAITCYQKALAFKPDYPAALSNLGNALRDQGRFDEAIACYRQALALRPGYAEALSNLGSAIFDLHYSERYCSNSTLDAASLYARHVEPTQLRGDFANAADPQRRLRIGYVSADFRNHPVGFLLFAALAAHDPGKFEVYCYSNSRADDDMTMRLREAAHSWRVIAALSDADADAMIRHDEIDILVDLSGHSAGNRLPLFALKPAPVQATWLGYLDTSGLGAMDYFLTDRFVVPAEDEGSFAETVLRLPDAHLCFSAEGLDVPVVARPDTGPLTLGSFNKWTKVSDGTIALWSRLMAEIPDSRLLVNTREVGDPETRRRAIERFAVHGISADRLMLEKPTSRIDLLAAYNRIDIALDPFPYNGCMTTAEALWMGVPVVTLRGKRSVSRAAEGILTVAGLAKLVAEDGDAYVAAVKALAEDRKHLSELRSSLRAVVEQSPICDGPRFTQALEGLYREMWKNWCSSRPGG
jgi:predicted O-linked N-acetylglucosamine transferase (SPINDLY family)